jgi:hypothetical protein
VRDACCCLRGVYPGEYLLDPPVNSTVSARYWAGKFCGWSGSDILASADELLQLA